MTKEYPIFEWRQGIPIMDQVENEQTPVSESNNEAKSFHSSDTKNNIALYEEEEEYAEEDEYDLE